MNHLGSITLETKRLILRKIHKGDVQEMYDNWASKDEVTKYLTWPTHTHIKVTKKVIAYWLEGYKSDDCYHWGIVIKETGILIGTISVVEVHKTHNYGEIGYCIGPHFWGKGYTTEALTEVNRFLLSEVGFGRIHAIHYPENIASKRVMEKAGMTYEGCLRGYHFSQKDNRRRDCMMYSLLKEDLHHT